MARHRTVPRTKEDRAVYAELMRELDDLVGRRERRQFDQLTKAYILWGAARVRGSLIASFADPATPHEDRAQIADILARYPAPPQPPESQ